MPVACLIRLAAVAMLALAGALPALAAPQAVTSGRADVFTDPPAVSGVVAGGSFTLDVTVDPRNVDIDAAAARLAFDAGALEVTALTPGGQLDTELARIVDNGAGVVFYAAGKLGGPWPSTSFVLARVTFRAKLSSGSASVSLVTQGRDGTDVASNGASVLGEARGTTVTLGTVPSGGSGGGGSGGSSGGSSRGSAPAPPPAPTAVRAPAPVASPAATASVAPPVPVVAPAAIPPGSVPALPRGVQVAVHPVAEPFQQFYAERQGMRVLGRTLAAAQVENGLTVQYFEKGRIELHPEEASAFWQLQYGLLVDQLVAAGAGLPVGGDASTLSYGALRQLVQPGARVAPPDGFAGGTATLPDGAVFVPFSASLAPEPGHLVPADFWAYINDEGLFPGGWLHDVGLPITEPVEAVVDKGPEKGRRIVVQGFQRTILTFDPLNPPDYLVERANVGTDYARVFRAVFGE